MDYKELEKLVIYEDNHFLVVNKPTGYLTQGDKTGDIPIVDEFKEYIKVKYDKPGKVFLHPVSRLDRPASGALILARTSKGLSRMTEIIRKRDIEKQYRAIVKGRIQEHEAELQHFLLKDHSKNRVALAKPSTPKAKSAKLSYRVTHFLDKATIVSIDLVTGRPHQIRVQFAAIGHPIIGDGKYGKNTQAGESKLYLHCERLAFLHPVKKEPIEIKAPFPSMPMWKEMND